MKLSATQQFIVKTNTTLFKPMSTNLFLWNHMHCAHLCPKSLSAVIKRVLNEPPSGTLAHVEIVPGTVGITPTDVPIVLKVGTRKNCSGCCWVYSGICNTHLFVHGQLGMSVTISGVWESGIVRFSSSAVTIIFARLQLLR